jgi:hypothetical protein
VKVEYSLIEIYYSMMWNQSNTTAQVGLHEMPADGTSPTSEAQTGCRLRQAYKDDLRLPISAPFKKILKGICKNLKQSHCIKE